MSKIVFFTGAGISRESGLPTFRGEDGIWHTLDVEAVAHRKSWYCGRRSNCNEKRKAVLDFFNPIRRMIITKNPNEAHYAIARLEEKHDITVITQNGDDFHERAGSTHVIHLHGEALKNASTLHPYESYHIDISNPDIHIGDKAPDGSQIRPYVIFFGEDIERNLWKKAVSATAEADIFVIIGSSMLVFPAAEIIKNIAAKCKVYVIDPNKITIPLSRCNPHIHMYCGAVEGMKELEKIL